MAIDTTKKIKQVTYNGKEIPLRGYDTSDANVTKHDLPLDITAYGPNGKVEGFVDTYGPNESVGCPFNSMTYNSSNKTITVKGDLGTPIMFRNGCSTTVSVGGDKFGDATAADVAKGKTFTSAAGLKVTGTAEERPVSIGIENTDFTEVWVGYAEYPHGHMSSTTVSNGQTAWVSVEEGSGIVIANTAFDGSEFEIVPSGGFFTESVGRSDVGTFIVDYSLNGKIVELLMK